MQLGLLAGEEQGRPDRHLEGSFSSRPGYWGKGCWREVAIGKPDAASARKHNIAHWMRLGPSAVCKSSQHVPAVEIVGNMQKTDTYALPRCMCINCNDDNDKTEHDCRTNLTFMLAAS